MSWKKQFAIVKQKLEVPDLCSRALPDGWVLYTHKELEVQATADGRCILLGLAWQFLPEKKSPLEELEALCARCPGPAPIPVEQVLEAEESWCGRYLLLCDGVVYTDTSSLIPVFYSEKGVASDCTFLAELGGQQRHNYEMPPRRIMNWMPGPLTQYDGVRRLLPSQLYRVATGEVLPRPLLAQHYTSISDEGERVARIIACFDASLRNMQAALPGTKLLVAITGGHDSRTLLALAKHAGIDFDAFTLLYDDIFADDVTVPQELCRVEGIRHHLVPRTEQPDAPAREQEYLDHISGLVYDEDRLYYAHRQFEPLVEQFGQVALLRSGVWPNVMEWYRRSFTADGPGFDCYDWFGAAKGSREAAAFDEYFAWQAEHPQPGLSACNVFYWDQRNGCWLSEIEKGFDLIDHVLSLQPANCRYLMTMLMDFSADDRIINHHQFKIVAKACPAFSAIPYGGRKRQNETAGKEFWDKLKRGVNRLRSLGLSKTFQTYASMVRARREERQLLRRQGRSH